MLIQVASDFYSKYTAKISAALLACPAAAGTSVYMNTYGIIHIFSDTVLCYVYTQVKKVTIYV